MIGTALTDAGVGGLFGRYMAATALITLVATPVLRPSRDADERGAQAVGNEGELMPRG
ncbi:MULTISPECIES: hypothetical protein [unclassified Amycolatopsis]|uniref:hypothetical protein n=1 Tax=unclassified Amycolatopsis TaxID=2618356 RepID=UPI001C697C7F|nr:hypothetical protein [Amycolatopsis sp. DSM 110486]QYN20390.1 hypothetical protein K1T34_49150 [Amycolatopsis sp. DSM 110486]